MVTGEIRSVMNRYATPPRPWPDHRLSSSPFWNDQTIVQIPQVTMVSRITNPAERRLPSCGAPYAAAGVPATCGATGAGGGGTPSDGGGGGGGGLSLMRTTLDASG